MPENQLYLDNMRIYFIRIPKYIIALLSVFLFSSCNGQNTIESTTHLKKYNLKGNVKLLNEKLCSALVSLDGTIEILDECVPPKDLGNPYKMEFNKQGYLTLHKYFAGNKFWRDYYEYKNDNILVNKKITYRQYVDKKPEWWIDRSYKYDKYGKAIFMGLYYVYIDKSPASEIELEYDKYGEVNKIKQNIYNYTEVNRNIILDSVNNLEFKYKNIYKDTLLISKQFMKSDGEILTFDKNGEVNEYHYGKFLESKDINGNDIIVGDKTIYKYNHLGHRTAITTVSAYGDSSTNSYTYYPNGDLKSSIYRDTQGKVYTTEKFNEEGYKTYYKSPFGPYYDYKYTERDDNGNWVTCQVNKNGRIYYFITREIEYYQD